MQLQTRSGTNGLSSQNNHLEHIEREIVVEVYVYLNLEGGLNHKVPKR